MPTDSASNNAANKLPDDNTPAEGMEGPTLLPIGLPIEEEQSVPSRWYTQADQIVLASLAGIMLVLIGFHWHRLRGKTLGPIPIETAEATTQPKKVEEGPIRVEAFKPNFDEALLQEPNPIPNQPPTPQLVSDEYTFRIDLNQADWLELTQLPGIGETLARRIVSYRELNGDFESVDEVRNVRGIGQKTLQKLKPYVLVKP